MSELSHCRSKISENNRLLADHSHRLSTEGEQFRKELLGISNRVNDQFARFMSQMNEAYKGQIVLTGVESFGSFGLNLEVRFREGDQFRPLTSGYQSGLSGRTLYWVGSCLGRELIGSGADWVPILDSVGF